MTKPRPWPDNAMHARDRTAAHSADIIINLRKLIAEANDPATIIRYSEMMDSAYRIYMHMVNQGAPSYLAD